MTIPVLHSNLDVFTSPSSLLKIYLPSNIQSISAYRDRKSLAIMPFLTEILSSVDFFLLALSGFSLWYLISSAVTWYRLRHIPGPFLAKFSYLWLAQTAQGARQYYIYRDLCKKYGPLVRIGPNELTTDDPEILRRAGAVRGSYGKDQWYAGSRLNPYHDIMFSTLDIPAHDRMKSQIGATFGGREVPLLEPGVDEQVKSLINNIRQNLVNDTRNDSSSLLDLAPLISYFTMDVITKVAFGQECGYLKANDDLHSFLREVRDNWPKIEMTVNIPLIRNIMLSPLFLKLFGPSVTDTKGMGKLMG